MPSTLRSSDVPRSPEWPKVARAHLQAHPECAACGPLWKPTTPVQVHHVFPVHFVRALQRPELELTETNVVECRAPHSTNYGASPDIPRTARMPSVKSRNDAA
jgi:hypothetical protein